MTTPSAKIASNRSALLRVTAGLEIVTGLLLLLAPDLPIRWLFGHAPITTVGTLVGRALGAALIPLGAACWWAAGDSGSSGGIMIKSMLLYNLIVSAVLIYAVSVVHLAGVLLWPAVVVHLVLAVWCIATLRSARPAGVSS